MFFIVIILLAGTLITNLFADLVIPLLNPKTPPVSLLYSIPALTTATAKMETLEIRANKNTYCAKPFSTLYLGLVFAPFPGGEVALLPTGSRYSPVPSGLFCTIFVSRRVAWTWLRIRPRDPTQASPSATRQVGHTPLR